jgi:hypothetical protein
MSATEFSIKSGVGRSDRTTSELATFFRVRPGHEDELREAVALFEQRVRESPPAETVHTGLRSTRHVIFDEGTRLLWCTTFETDFDPYFDDALLTVGVANFIEWIQHTIEGEAIIDWFERNGGAAAFDKSNPDYTEVARRALPELKAIITTVQVGAAAYFESMSTWTMTEIIQSAALREAFDKVLEHPDAEQALQHPALAPVLKLAAS